MPIYKIRSSKAKPDKAIDYVINPRKAAMVATIALCDGEPYGRQFRDTAAQHGKELTEKSRKYYHAKLSFAPSDGVTVEKAMKIAMEHSLKAFPDHECVIGIHTDRKHIHAHIIVNSVNFAHGKMLQISDAKYGKLKDLANTLAANEGFSTVDFRKKAKATAASFEERQMRRRGAEPWKDELRTVINEAKAYCNTMTEFESWLARYGVKLGRNTEQTISYIHPTQEKAVRGQKLGEEYTAQAIRDALAAPKAAPQTAEPPMITARPISGELLGIARGVFAHTAKGQSPTAQSRTAGRAYLGGELSKQARKEKALEQRDNGYER